MLFGSPGVHPAARPPCWFGASRRRVDVSRTRVRLGEAGACAFIASDAVGGAMPHPADWMRSLYQQTMFCEGPAGQVTAQP